MTKRNAIEILREAIRNLRIQRDQGNDALQDQILHLTSLLCRLQSLPAKDAVKLAEQYNINDD